MAITRQLLFSMSLEPDQISVGGFYSYAQARDGNGDGALFSCAYCPPLKSGAISLVQDQVFLGMHGADAMLQSFNNNKTLDGEEDLDAFAILNLLAPTGKDQEPLGLVRFVALEMANINTLEKGLVVQYCIDAESPHLSAPLWIATHYSSGNKCYFPRAVGRWIHLKVIDETLYVGRDVFGGFALEYYELGTRQAEASS